MSTYTKIADTNEIKDGQAKCVEISGKRIAIFNLDGTYYAIDDSCTHAGGPLSEGDIEGTQVTCPWHGACFDIASGEALSAPAAIGVKSYQVKVEGNDLKLEL